MRFGQVGDGREGVPSLGIGDDLIDTIVELVASSARRARPSIVALDRINENGVSIELFKQIVQMQRRRRIKSVEFHPEGILLGSGEMAPTRYRGRIDFQVKTSEQFGDYDRYFGIECKLLKAGQPSKTRYYARAGVGKFADGTYSPGHPMAMLVGYVLAPGRLGRGNPLRDAIRDVARGMARYHAGVSPLITWRARHPGALIRVNQVPRTDAEPIKLVHAMLRMFP